MGSDQTFWDTLTKQTLNGTEPYDLKNAYKPKPLGAVK